MLGVGKTATLDSCPSRAWFCSSCFRGKQGHHYMVTLSGDMCKMILKETVLLVPCKSRATWITPSEKWCCLAMLTQCLAILCYLGLKIKEKYNNNNSKKPSKFASALGMLAHRQDDYIPHTSQTYIIRSAEQCENRLL